MSADQEPLEFLAKQPWRPKKVTEDPDEEDEEDSDETNNGFSLEEVLRLGGTKVTAAGSGEGVCTAAGSVGPAAQPPTRSERLPHFYFYGSSVEKKQFG